jgi:hypothetical protein
MPLYASAFFLPTSPSIPFLLEDIYLRGGYRTVATIAERDGIRPAARKKGMIVFVQEDDTMYWIPGATGGVSAWKEYDVTKYVNFIFQEPLILDINEETGERTVRVDATRLLPAAPEEGEYVLVSTSEGPAWVVSDALPSTDDAEGGDVLILDFEKKPIWGKVDALPPSDASDKGKALVLDDEGSPYWGAALPEPDDQQPGSVLLLDGDRKPVWSSLAQANDRETIVLEMGSIAADGERTESITLNSSTIMMLEFTLSAPEIQVELHSDNTFSDTNPFIFVSSLAKMSDDGLSFDDEGSVTVHRRYAFYSDAQNQKQIHVKATNLGDVTRIVNITLVYLNME